MSVINNQKRFVWIWVPKSAGTSIYHKLLQNRINAGLEGNHGIFRTLELKINTQEYFKWAFVRNPYERLASAYFHLTNSHGFHFYKDFDDFILNDFYDKDGSLSIENSKMKTHSTLRDIIHLRPQTYFLQDRQGIVNFDFIGKVEYIERDWQFVCLRLGIKTTPLEIFNSRVPMEKYSQPLPAPPPEEAKLSKYFKYFEGPQSDEKLHIMQEIYKDDFKNFGYEV